MKTSKGVVESTILPSLTIAPVDKWISLRAGSVPDGSVDDFERLKKGLNGELAAQWIWKKVLDFRYKQRFSAMDGRATPFP
jgi:hypothetical protein